MNTVATPMYGWDSIPWKKFRRSVFKLQKRIYRATLQGKGKLVRKLQRLLMSSRAAKFWPFGGLPRRTRGRRPPVSMASSLYPNARDFGWPRTYASTDLPNLSAVCGLIKPTPLKNVPWVYR